MYKLILNLNHSDGAGPALMAMWYKALPLTASCLPLLSGFKSQPGYVRKLPVTCG